MKNNNILVLLSIIFIISSCDRDKKNGFYIRNDFENYSDWGVDASFVYKGNAHSGNHFTKVDSQHVYSMTFRKELKEFDFKSVKTAKFSCWVYTNDLTADAVFVFAIDKGSISFVYSGNEIKKFVSVAGKWAKLNGSIDLPQNLSSEANISMYGWSRDKKEVLFDDMELELIK